MTADDGLPEDLTEDLFENAPCGYLATRPDGTIVKVNRTLEEWTGFTREQLLDGRRLKDLLSPGGRIYHETHYSPLLQMQGSVREIAVEIVRADGTRLPALINSVLRRDEDGRPRVIRTTVFDATDRRRYEQELLRARRREQEIAQQLQGSLLSGELPAGDGFELEVVYRPAVSGLDVGGDWYDAFWLEEGETVGFVVGDVVGRGIGAATTMGQLRSAVRALASTGLGPGALLEALDRYSRRHAVGRMTTLVYAQLSLSSGNFRYACAGHPPPVLAAPGRDPCFVWDGRSLPLDAHSAAGRSRDEASRTLAPGSAVMLYTDGLVERRTRPLSDGLDRLLGEVANTLSSGSDPGELAAPVVRAMQDAEPADDVCVLALRLAAANPTS